MACTLASGDGTVSTRSDSTGTTSGWTGHPPYGYRTVELKYYPLRPELAESTYHLYRATKNPFYLHVGREILDSLNTMTRVRSPRLPLLIPLPSGQVRVCHCPQRGGWHHRGQDGVVLPLGNHTVPLLGWISFNWQRHRHFQLFHPEHWVNKNEERLIFSTEGHIFPVTEFFQRKPEEIFKVRHKNKAMKVNTNKSKKPYVPHPDGRRSLSPLNKRIFRGTLHVHPGAEQHLRDGPPLQDLPAAVGRDLHGIPLRDGRNAGQVVELIPLLIILLSPYIFPPYFYHHFCCLPSPVICL